MSSTVTEKAVVGRRIAFTYYRDLDKDQAPSHPGIITELIPAQKASLKIRLDGHRSSLHVPPDYQGLRYLDEVLDPVPALPMGRFHPSLDDLEGEWEGVPICSLGEDGALIALTADLAAAVSAMNTYRRDVEGCMYDAEFSTVTADHLQPKWAYFEWQPEDAECPWFVNWTDEGDDMAIQLHYLPA